MEQKKKNEKDVLVVRDEKTGEISVVAGLDSKGYPKTAPAKAEHSQDFLRFDRHGDMVDNFFRNFYRQCKEPTRFGFYRVAADMADAVLPVIKDLLKDPAANAEMLAAHKVDTSEYQKQAETMEQAQPKGTDTEKANNENTNEENNVQQKTEEMEELKQEQSVQPSQEGGTPTEQVQEPPQEQQQQKPEKPNLIADDQVDWEELRKCGIDREKLSEKDLKALMNYGKTGLVTVKPTFGYESYELQARLSFQKTEDGKLKLTPHFIRDAPRLDVPYKGYSFTDEDRNNLKHTGNLGKMVSVADERTGEFRPSYISIDRLTNEIVDVPANKVRIPDKIGLTPVSSAEKDILRAGLALPKEVTLKNGRKFHALLQVNANKRDVEFVPGQKNQNQAQRLADSRRGQNNDPSDTQQNQGNESDGKRQRRNRSWTNEDGSIRPIGKWLDNIFTDQQKADYVAGKTVVLANAKDDQGQPCTKYLKFSHEKGRPLTYSQNPDLAQTVAPSNESRTQLAVNNEGKTNEATKHVKEPLQQGQTAPKNETQQKQQTRKSKGMKVS
ncbi:DUF4099 domain-containing protein [Bacteroides caecigallinarum]|uniref:DUF4099 domain-containing protein n=1 Tax=Bacteroides caecigallinarum TaxID=1411144 RepID=UPI001F157AEA|nr:DUF4099 domain-containing protein [Bacteroides caecigallinarum]MCF2581681.1 DUF3945 domain-containing protein [Bacteroides caecigallinarum]